MPGLVDSRLVVGAIVVLAFLATRGEAIKCYDCNSEYDPRCGERFDPYSLGTIDCNDRQPLEHLREHNATLCRKLVQKISGKIRVVRTCGYITDPKDGTCVSRSGTHDISVQYCSCTGDLCNAAPSSLSSASLTVALAAAVSALLLTAAPTL